ncbi:MAG: HEPN domain-containing protein [bacterium]
MMNIEEATSWWNNAIEAIKMAQFGITVSPNGAANRAYYAAFYAVSALFSLDDIEFKKHYAVESAVHRDLVNTGRWRPELGKKYSDLFKLRMVGDYGNTERVTTEEADAAIFDAREILEAVHKEHPDLFPL